MPRRSVHVRLLPAVLLSAPLLAVALLAATAGTAVAAPATRAQAATGYQVLVTSAPGGARLARVIPGREGQRAGPAVRLRLGGQNLVVPLASQARHGPGSFAVSVVTHAGRAPATGGTVRTLTVAGTDLAGQPATTGSVLVGDVANANAPGTGFGTFSGGTATFRVPAGTYWAVALFPQFTGGRLVSLRMDVLPQFQVTQNTTVQAGAAAATSRVTMVTPRPATTRSLSLTLVRAAPHAPPNGLSSKVNSLEQSVSGASLWVNPVSHGPSYGTLRVFTSAQLTSPPGQAVPYAYALNFASPPGTIGSEHFTVGPSNLATESERYVQDVRTVAGWETLGGTRYQILTSFVGDLVFPLRLPGHQVQYISASPPMLWQTDYFEYRSILAGQSPGGQAAALRVLHPGQRLAQAWNAYPLHPGSNVSFPGSVALARSSATRSGNTLSLDLTPFSDNQHGHLGAGLAVPIPGKIHQVSGSYALYQDGVKIAGGNAVKAAGGFGDVQVSAALSAKPALIRFVLNASRASAQYPLSAASRDSWTWHSRPQPGATIPAPWMCDFAPVPPAQDRHCAVQPMVTLSYNVAGLGLDGTTAPGQQSVTVTAGHIQLAPRIPVTRASAAVSFDGGKTWQPAQVRPLGAGRFRATFDAAAGTRVSLRVSARDSAGNALTETILNAYRTSA